MSGTLYIKHSVGLVPISLDRVKGATMLRFVCGKQVEEYDLAGGGSGIMPGRQEGDPTITLQTKMCDSYPLANWPDAVAVTVSDRLYLLKDGRWCREPDENASTVRSRIENLYFPDGYDLPD